MATTTAPPLDLFSDQGAELMGKFGVNVPKGVAVSSVQEVRKAIQDVFPSESEGGVHIVKVDQVEEIAGKMLGQILVTKQTRPQGKVVSKVSLVNELYFAITLDRKTAGPILVLIFVFGMAVAIVFIVMLEEFECHAF
ncbi:hypothetical protein ACSBR2_020932 [Camellia fascicularis]